ncbi:Zn-dependent hydrolase [Flexistipes sp.]|uniref:Zn-dependent hydrolase n=1 Tax=Flexistipes sp. TaxID=3088135 RepID=UPI002E2086FF|nr:Zn-dependent hydrolase [Flexistipes sp.]
MKRINIDSTRLWHTIMEMAKIGATPKGGVKRLALTETDKAARDLFCFWAESDGFECEYDSMGNIYVTLRGTSKDLQPVLIGSHLDTQPTGGKFDGIYGVMAGYEVIRTIKEQGIKTSRPITVVNWTNEEGVRFAPAMAGSGVFSGVYAEEEIYNSKDNNGMTFEGELEKIGYMGNKKSVDYKAGIYIEPHIEQGPILESGNYKIGIVKGVQGQLSLDVSVIGFESHSGSTPMNMRKDALVSSSRMCLALNRIATEQFPGSVATVGRMIVQPGARNTVPGKTSFTIDIRHPRKEILFEMETKIKQNFQNIADETATKVEIRKAWFTPPVVFDNICIETIRKSTEFLGYNFREMVSGAGHDACMVNNKIPGCMIFVPCEKGISHNELEKAVPEDLAAGANVLLYSVMDFAV